MCSHNKTTTHYLPHAFAQGNGIYLSPTGEKYVGSWAGGKKEGTGRYSFKNGDFYDGQFHKNKAQGLGVYYHANGNIFTGQWVSALNFCVDACVVVVILSSVDKTAVSE